MANLVDLAGVFRTTTKNVVNFLEEKSAPRQNPRYAYDGTSICNQVRRPTVIPLSIILPLSVSYLVPSYLVMEAATVRYYH